MIEIKDIDDVKMHAVLGAQKLVSYMSRVTKEEASAPVQLNITLTEAATLVTLLTQELIKGENPLKTPAVERHLAVLLCKTGLAATEALPASLDGEVTH